MKKLGFIFLFIFSYFSAQTHRFVYEVYYKKDSAENLITKENYYLDINPDESFYYGRPYFVSDSIFQATKEMSWSGGILTDIIRKDLKSNEYDVFIMEGFDTFKIKEKIKQTWKILSETRVLNNLKLQKAITKWGGRNWTAWFTMEFPFQEGPYKFNGLPGLIVELSDDKNNFDFKLVKSENIKTSQILEFYKTIKAHAVEIPADKYMNIKLQTYATPIKAAHDGTFDVTKTNFITEENIQISTAKELRDYEEGKRKSLKKYNNPIELDKAPHYPKD